MKTESPTDYLKNGGIFTISKEEITSLMSRLSKHGAGDGPGITRLLYDAEWLSFQRDIIEVMRASGIKAAFDGVGNVIGRVSGSSPNAITIATGSHADTVRCAGSYDGQLGIAIGIIAVNQLLERFGTPKNNLEIVSFAEEEGSRFAYTFWGSKNYVGTADTHDVKNLCDDDGVGFIEAMRNCGFSTAEKPEKPCIPDIFLELHIEQGDELESSGCQIGVVSRIKAQTRFVVSLKGRANHAGTSSMASRNDALWGFSEICVKAMNKAKGFDDQLTLTFGKINVYPNTPNVIPGEAVFSVDCRHKNNQKLKKFIAEMKEEFINTAKCLGLSIEFSDEMFTGSVGMHKPLSNMLEQICRQRRIEYRVMSSGAGHDTQIIAPFARSAMIFVPSKGGVSHNPCEYTDIESIAIGASIIAQAIYQLAY